jgi:hypothetical protein
MAIVPIEIKGQLKTKNVEPLSNFTLYVIENGITIHKHQNNNVTTVNGKNTFLTLIESYITQNSNGPNGSITSSSIVVDATNGHITIDIEGTGDNACDHFAGAFFTQETWDEQKNDTIAMRFLSEEIETQLCVDCQDVEIAYCDGNPEFTIPIEDGSYLVVIEDHNTNNFYSQNIDVVDGIVEWSMNEYENIFMPFTYYTLTITDVNGNVVTWSQATDEYNCLRFTFKYSTDTNLPT